MVTLNTNYLTNMLNQIANAKDCETLQSIETQLQQYFLDQLASILHGINALEPLTKIPTNLGEVITWIENLVGLNILLPYQSLIASYAQMISFQNAVAAALATRITGLECSFNPPSSISSSSSSSRSSSSSSSSSRSSSSSSSCRSSSSSSSTA